MPKDRANDISRKGDASRAKSFGPEHANVVKNAVGNLIEPRSLISKTSGGTCSHCNKPVGDSIHMNVLGHHIVSDRIA